MVLLVGVAVAALATGPAASQEEAAADRHGSGWSREVLGTAVGRTFVFDPEPEMDRLSTPDQVRVTGTEDGENDLLSLVTRTLRVPAPAPDALVDGPLHQAARSGDLEALRRLLGADTEVDLAGSLGRTPLMLAAAGSCLPCLDLLLNGGADPGRADRSGNTALFYAASSGLAAVEVLLGAGADPRHRNDVGQTALGPAIHNGSLPVVRRLLAAATPVSAALECVGAACDPGAFASAVLRGRIELADLVRRSALGARVSAARLPSGRSLLDAVAENGDVAAVSYLLGQGALDDRADSGLGSVALLSATVAGHADVVRVLLQAGVPAGIEDAQGFAALQLAARHGHAPVASELLARAVDPDRPGREATRSPALQLAARDGHVDVVRALLDAGAAVDASNRHAVTPLMAASYHGHEVIVDLLLVAGADPGRATAMGNTALIYASIEPHGRVIELLLEHGADPNVVAFIEAFGEVSPLMLAAGRGHLAVVGRLLDHGADPGFVCDAEGFGRITATEMARLRGFREVVERLGTGGS